MSKQRDIDFNFAYLKASAKSVAAPKTKMIPTFIPEPFTPQITANISKIPSSPP